ncbi:lachesin [Caerostris extrusa]|uniref:Lachesin n=1 Tax=Caerostris extrusa TaxID=172846 RepID=A0AAV4NLG1_CAEEX|nr:lachesin [Caerostris extrusa]
MRAKGIGSVWISISSGILEEGEAQGHQSGTVGNTRNIVQRVEGEFLNLTQVTREDMGAYLCIAKNGVPDCQQENPAAVPPKIRVTNQMVYAVGGTDAVLGCILEASPRPLTSWIRHDEAVLINNSKFEIVEKEEDSYKIIMQLKIRNVSNNDFGHYKCVAKNTFGDKEGFVRLIEQITTTTTVMSTVPFRVFIPIQRGTPEAKKEYGAPTTNSLRDESQVVSSASGSAQAFFVAHLALLVNLFVSLININLVSA